MKRSTLLAAAILIAAALGCKLPSALKGSSANTANSNRGSAVADQDTGTSAAPSDPKAEIAKAAAKFSSLPFFTADMNGTGEQPMKMTVAYAAPDKYHLTYTSGKITGTETIIIGENTYTRVGSKWMKFPVSIAGTISQLRDQFNEEGLKRLSDLKYEGAEDVDGKPADRYSYSSTTPENGVSYRSSVWIGKQSGLPIKIVADYENSKLKQMTIVYDTDTPVTIEAPIK